MMTKTAKDYLNSLSANNQVVFTDPIREREYIQQGVTFTMGENIMPIKITLTYDDGSTEEKEIGGIFEAENGNTYAVLYDDKTIIDGTIEFVRLIPFKNDDGEEDFHIENLNSEEEYEIVTRAFNNIISTTFDDTDTNVSADEDTVSQADEPIKTLDGEEILLSGADGTRVKWILIKMFDFQTHTYAVMRKKDKDELHILRAIVTDTPNANFANCRFDSIDSDEEFQKVQDYFIKRFSEEL